MSFDMPQSCSLLGECFTRRTSVPYDKFCLARRGRRDSGHWPRLLVLLLKCFFKLITEVKDLVVAHVGHVIKHD